MPIPDASIAVALFLTGDPNHDCARDWYEGVRDAGGRLRAPAILLAEVSSAITRSHQDPARAEATIATILRLGIFEIHAISPVLAVRAAEIARTASLRGCDAIYVAFAAELDDVLVTLDDEQFVRGGRIARVERPA
ncbi:MAG: type II toxin-antitoxin system VapC family toxin [Dehalococcoidia bacterium]